MSLQPKLKLIVRLHLYWLSRDAGLLGCKSYVEWKAVTDVLKDSNATIFRMK